MPVEMPEGTKEIAARFLIGCDGGNSTARRARALRPTIWGSTSLARHRHGAEGRCHAHLPSAFHTAIRRGPSPDADGAGRYRFEFMLLPLKSRKTSRATRRRRDDFAPPRSRAVRDRASRHRFHALIAKEWRKVRSFAGDGRTRCRPSVKVFVGTRDAANLARRSRRCFAAARAMRHSTPIAAQPHVRMITGTAVALGKIVCTQDVKLFPLANDMLVAGRQAHERDDRA